ncbi:hypothetical protein [Streptomyces sp. NPDC020298]
MSGVLMRPSELYAEDLVFEHEATAETGVPGPVIRQWARRGKIQKFQGDGRLTGNGHEFKTMYALPEVRERAKTYRPMPQRRPAAT